MIKLNKTVCIENEQDWNDRTTDNYFNDKGRFYGGKPESFPAFFSYDSQCNFYYRLSKEEFLDYIEEQIEEHEYHIQACKRIKGILT